MRSARNNFVEYLLALPASSEERSATSRSGLMPFEGRLMKVFIKITGMSIVFSA
jgi:hypothetical protein